MEASETRVFDFVFEGDCVKTSWVVNETSYLLHLSGLFDPNGADYYHRCYCLLEDYDGFFYRPSSSTHHHHLDCSDPSVTWNAAASAGHDRDFLISNEGSTSASFHRHRLIAARSFACCC